MIAKTSLRLPRIRPLQRIGRLRSNNFLCLFGQDSNTKNVFDESISSERTTEIQAKVVAAILPNLRQAYRSRDLQNR
jgi:hypothetical protein